MTTTWIGVVDGSSFRPSCSLQRGEDVRTVVGRRVRCWWRTGRSPFESELVEAGETGLIDDQASGDVADSSGELSQHDPARDVAPGSVCGGAAGGPV